MPDLGYGVLDRFLYRLALQFNPIAELSFDLDQHATGPRDEYIRSQRHVFVAGLARSGTTILMRRFYDSGIYRALTYQDMPFVLAPNLWRRLTAFSSREIPTAERAHGDSIQVNEKSPESFDEVFWRVFSGDSYIEMDHLKPHNPHQDIIRKYINYVDAILSSEMPFRHRYLSKNNNNILRLGGILEAFPNALILIPFRDPLQHAYSLLQQHLRFSKMQRENGFVLSYMSWLGHHEFGIDHRPFRLDDKESATLSIDTLDYWLQTWCNVYSWLEERKPPASFFVCYEDLCEHPTYWSYLASLADLPKKCKDKANFRVCTRKLASGFTPELADQAMQIYMRIQSHSRIALNFQCCPEPDRQDHLG